MKLLSLQFYKIIFNLFSKIEVLKNVNTTDVKLKVLIVNCKDTKGTNYNWSQYSGWILDGSTERYSLDVVGYSSSNYGTIMSVTNYVEAKGQQKKWGTWDYRNSYNPIYSVSGNWNYRYQWTPDGLNINVGYSLSSSYAASPYNYILNGSNHFMAYLSPQGTYSLTSPAYWIDPVNVYYYRFTGSFFGGSSGYYIYLNRG